MWRPLELCWWPEQGKLPAKGKEYPGLGYKRVRDKPPKAQQQQQPAAPCSSQAATEAVRSSAIGGLVTMYNVNALVQSGSEPQWRLTKPADLLGLVA
ncbi:hypothetical protein HaLaN_04678 [Haematococcus lacustris]|uniref:Uncharacterized protein n=1 Tax=Haematococcus lacustris TaxID=44745 RepID=A0A699YT48_HAELA|nr:hypothetical protein HaLaN_04678 [Haematococcus lacustris]